MDTPVEVEAKNSYPGEVTQEDKIEEVAQEATHVVPCQSAGCKIKQKDKRRRTYLQMRF